MKARIKTMKIILTLCVFAGFQSGFVFAASSPALEERIAELEKQMANQQNGFSTGQISDRIKLSGAIEVDYSYSDDSDLSERSAGNSTSDLDVGTVELGLEAGLHEYITASVLLKGEALDSDTRVFWDEAFFEIKKQDFPLYLVAGKRVQPFGSFENLFINDPITCELYEINDTGLTIGFADEAVFNLDVSFTLYKGETLITKLNDADLGWSRNNTAGFTVSNDVNSYIVSTSIEPVQNLLLSVSYNSEPGDTDRNTTLGAALHARALNFILDLEYIRALSRERHVADNTEYTENAWVVSLGYQIMDPLLVAVRYEFFDADKTSAGNLENRYSIGGVYTLFEKDSFVCSLMGEYRRSAFETPAGSSNDDKADEFFTRIAIEF